IWRGKDGTLMQHARIADLEIKVGGVRARYEEIKERLRRIEQAREEGKDWPELSALITATPEKLAGEKDRPSLDELMLPLLLQEQTLLQNFAEEHPEVQVVRQKMALTKSLYQRFGPGKLKKGEGKTAAGEDLVDLYVQTLKSEQLGLEISDQALTRYLEAE